MRSGSRRLLFLVTVLAGLAVSCERPFAMPPAKVKLPGYRIQSGFSEGLAVIQRPSDFKLGYVDVTGMVVLPVRFSDAGPFFEGLAPVRQERRSEFGYIDREGRMVIEEEFDSALPFSEGLAPVRLDAKWGYIDTTGSLRIPARYDDAFEFSEGRARVMNDGLLGFIDTKGDWIVPATYFKAGDFHQGLAYVCDRSLCGFVDLSGKVVIDLRFDDAGPFASGRAPVRQGEKWGYADTAGRIAIPAAFDDAAGFSHGLARIGVIKDSSFDAKFGGYSGRATFHGFIDPDGRSVIGPSILGATSFSEGLSVIRVPSGGFCSDCYQYRLMTVDGTFLPGRFDLAYPASSGLTVVAAGGKSYAVDGKASPVIEFDRSYLEDFLRSARSIPGIRFGFIDTAGGTVLSHELTSAQPFSEGLALVEGRPDGKRLQRSFIDRSGTVVLDLPKAISQALPFSGGLSLVSQMKDKSLRYGFMNRNGELAIGIEFADAASFSEGLAAVKVSRDLGANDWGYIDLSGLFVIKPAFKAAGSFSNGLAYIEWVTKESFLLGAVIDRKGSHVVEKPFVQELSRALFGTPSLEQFRVRRSFHFGEALVPKIDGTGRGFVDTNDRFVIRDSRFLQMGLFSEGRAPVQVQSGPAYHGAWGFVDPKGKLAVAPRFAHVQRFSDGLAGVRDVVGRSGFVDLAGEWAVPPMWVDEVHPFSEGRARVKVNGRWGYIDRTGQFAIPPRYLRAESFSDGLAVTAIAKKSPAPK